MYVFVSLTANVPLVNNVCVVSSGFVLSVYISKLSVTFTFVNSTVPRFSTLILYSITSFSFTVIWLKPSLLWSFTFSTVFVTFIPGNEFVISFPFTVLIYPVGTVTSSNV